MLNFSFSFLCSFLIVISGESPSLAQPSIIETIQNAAPSIVSINAEVIGAVDSPQTAAAIDKNTGRLLVLKRVKAASYKRSGAGVIIDPTGLIATNFHTISHANKITVTLSSAITAIATIIRIYPENDLAFIHINPPMPLSAIQFADSDNLRLNDEVFTIGHSELLSQTISGGKIIGIGSNRTKEKGDTENTDMFQVNMNLYRGDSGGPLFDRHGQFVGLVAAGQENVDRSTFVIPSNKIEKHYLEYLAIIQKK